MAVVLVCALFLLVLPKQAWRATGGIWLGAGAILTITGVKKLTKKD